MFARLMPPVDQWPFEDPRNTASIVVDGVLSGKRPILTVSHDVDDGFWQFLPGGECDESDARVVCLEDVLRADSSIADLASLPFGWLAERSRIGARWHRTPQVPTTWQELLTRAHEYTAAKQATFMAILERVASDNYHLEQVPPSLEFSSEGTVGLNVRVDIIGSLSAASGTWLWAWGNSSVDPKASSAADRVRRFGEQHGLERLASPKWDADEVDASEMTQVACFLLGGDGIYRMPSDVVTSYVVVQDLNDGDAHG